MLNNLLENNSKIDEFLDSSKENSLIVLYGAGFAMPTALKKLEKYGFTVAAICDSDPKKQGVKFRDTYPVMSLDEAQAAFPSARFVISSPNYFWEIYSLLSERLQAHNLCDIDLECTHYFEKGEFHAFFEAELDRFNAIYDRLEDEDSKDTYFKVIKAHMTGKRRDFEDAFTGNDDWYLFETLLKPDADAVYVDCGAYDGDTVQLFLTAADAGYRKVFAFEPDSARLPSLTALADSQNGKIEIVPKGVANSDGTIKFIANGVYSNIVGTNTNVEDEFVSIPITRLDSLSDLEGVSIVKMDIEGGEYDALLGAETLIRKYRPKLAICLYHKVEDYIRIAELILQFVPEYKIRIKHQSKGCTDTILFATLA